ncbi:MAG: hypothetical protein U0Q03_03315 [Acidimicrobiales bacterium]
MGIVQWWQTQRGQRRSAPQAMASHLSAVPSVPATMVTGPVTVVEAALSPELLAPIAGVTVEQYVAVSKGVAAYNYDQAKLPLVAAELGIDGTAWETAAAGFNARVSTSPAFARHFNALYRAARQRAS